MAHVTFNNVNDAFKLLVNSIADDDYPIVRTPSRAGDVLQILEPMTVTYLNPRERVLFNEARDCNPFFHLMESLWMLAGRNDVAPMAYYSSGISDIASDDGVTFNGAYGHRWRCNILTQYNERLGAYEGKDVDQLPLIIKQLREKPNSRRVVLQMWNVEDDLLKIDTTKDVCCNTNAYFLLNNGKLDMTVCNRSNDMIWGMLGANVVHFSILQEYLAAHIGVEVGRYNQFTNNLHVYTERWTPEYWLADSTPDYYRERTPPVNPFPLVQNPAKFDEELKTFNTNWLGRDLRKIVLTARFQEPFFQHVAWPMVKAYHFYKVKDFSAALRACSEIEADDWRIVATAWMNVRKARYDNRNPYLENELKRMGS